MKDTNTFTLNEMFNQKMTENGDVAFTRASDNNLLNILFFAEYYQKHLEEVKLGQTDIEKLFAMFIRDPRYGLGRRDLGRKLMSLSECSAEEILTAGRADDLIWTLGINADVLDFLKKEIENGNELVKKWMPRYSSKNLMVARQIAAYWGMNKQQYGKFIKCNTVENKLSRKETNEIEFEHVPSQAMLKYTKRFETGADTAERFAEYMERVKAGEADLKISTTTVYDIYKNRTKIDPDVFFDKIEKISGNWIPIVDTSGSMFDANDSIGKAMAVGHYLSKCSTYAPDKIITFSSRPRLVTLGSEPEIVYDYCFERFAPGIDQYKYCREIRSMFTGDCSNTDFGAVMNLLKTMETFPEYLIVLSDQEFDAGSNRSKTELETLWKENGIRTKIIWWNFNSRQTTAPEMDDRGNIYISGYSPVLLKYMESGFDGNAFIEKLLSEYKKKIAK